MGLAVSPREVEGVPMLLSRWWKIVHFESPTSPTLRLSWFQVPVFFGRLGLVLAAVCSREHEKASRCTFMDPTRFAPAVES